MKQSIKTCLAVLLAVCSAAICSGQKSSKAIVDDFNSLVGSWQGSLTYLDYTSGKPYTMPADVEIKRVEGTNKFTFSNIYPKEQSANSVHIMTISEDGQLIDMESVKTVRKLENGDTEIITEEKGKDGNDNRPATFRHTYVIGKHQYSKRKEVQFEGDTAWVKRHEYTYIRKPGN